MTPVKRTESIEQADSSPREQESDARSLNRSLRRVVPHQGNAAPSDVYIEIRPNRILRVVHLNGQRPEETSATPSVRGNGELVEDTAADVHAGSRDVAVASEQGSQISTGKLRKRTKRSRKTPVALSMSQGVDNQAFQTCKQDNAKRVPAQTSDSQSGSGPDPDHQPDHTATAGNVDIDLESSGEMDSNQAPTTASSVDIRDVVLFFIHGVGGSSDVWRQQLDFFSSLGYEVVCPDLIGHGFSSAPHNQRAYTFEEISVDLLLIFDKFCKDSNIVIGHSYGCSFAAFLARQRHGKVCKMVLVSGGSPIPLAPQPGIFSLPTCILSCVRPIISRGFRKYVPSCNSVVLNKWAKVTLWTEELKKKRRFRQHSNPFPPLSVGCTE